MIVETACTDSSLRYQQLKALWAKEDDPKTKKGEKTASNVKINAC